MEGKRPKGADIVVLSCRWGVGPDVQDRWYTNNGWWTLHAHVIYTAYLQGEVSGVPREPGREPGDEELTLDRCSNYGSQ